MSTDSSLLRVIRATASLLGPAVPGFVGQPLPSLDEQTETPGGEMTYPLSPGIQVPGFKGVGLPSSGFCRPTYFRSSRIDPALEDTIKFPTGAFSVPARDMSSPGVTCSPRRDQTHSLESKDLCDYRWGRVTHPGKARALCRERASAAVM